jgi:hypothetical protein
MPDFRYETSAWFERALCDHVKSLNPQATVDFNYHGKPPFSCEAAHSQWRSSTTH